MGKRIAINEEGEEIVEIWVKIKRSLMKIIICGLA